MSNIKNNWFYFITFIIIKLFFSTTVVSDSENSFIDFLFVLYPFIAEIAPIVLLIILNIAKKNRDLLNVYALSFLVAIVAPVVLRIFSGAFYSNASFLTKTICYIIVDIYLLFKILKKDKITTFEFLNNIEFKESNTEPQNEYIKFEVDKKDENANTEVKNDGYKKEKYTIDDIVKEFKEKNYYPRYIFLIIYNLIIFFWTFTVWTTFYWTGVVIIGSLISIIVYFVTPLLIFLLFRKHKNKGLIILISYVLTIVLFNLAQSFG